MTGIFTPAYSVSKRTGSDGLARRSRSAARSPAPAEPLKEAKQIEAKLLAEVAAGRYQDTQGVEVAELVDRWLE